MVWCFQLLSVPRWEFQSGGLRDGKPSSSGQENVEHGIKRRLSLPLHPSHHPHPGSELPSVCGGGGGVEAQRLSFWNWSSNVTFLCRVFNEVGWDLIPWHSVCRKVTATWSQGWSGPGCRDGWGVNHGHLQEDQDGHIIFCFLIDRRTRASSTLPSADPGYILGTNTTLDCQNRKDPFISHPCMLFLGNIFRWLRHQNNIKRYSFNGLIPLWVPHSAQRQLLSWLPM